MRKNVPYHSILSVTFLVAIITYSFLGGGWEVFIFGPILLIILLVTVLKVGSMLKRHSGGWSALLLSLFVISATIVLMRLTITVATDAPGPFYAIDSLGQRLFKESPDLPLNYGSLISTLFFATIIYFFGSLFLISKSIKKNNGRISPITSVSIIFVAISLLVSSLWPLGSAWAKSRAPGHQQTLARILQVDLNNYMTSAWQMITTASGLYAKTHSYVGSCAEEAQYNIGYPMTCRESQNEYIFYIKVNNEYGYVCTDTSGIITAVRSRPEGFSCGSGQELIAASGFIRKGVSVNGNFSHVGISKTAAVNDCGILSYKDNTEQSQDIGASDCFNQAIKSCQPAVISGVIDGFISTYQVTGKEDGKCVLIQRFLKQVSDKETQSSSLTCVIDPVIGWSSLSGCVQSD